ncbi:MAG: hypothetical protein MI747_24330 [Desulfobacterales bacterium]|nr:hypothetical protein [Desulfobacterales bacterium]
MFRNILISIVVLVFVAGCSEVPKPVSHRMTVQKKIQAAQHWQAISQDIGRTMIQATQQSPFQSIALLPNDNSSFCQASRSFLATYFINQGKALENRHIADCQLDWSVQNVHHTQSGKSRGWPGKTTTLAAIGYGVYKMIDDGSTSLAVVGTGMAADLGYELYKAGTVSLPRNEIIINVTLMKQGKPIHRTSHIYYINDGNLSHYNFTRDHMATENAFNQKTFYISD